MTFDVDYFIEKFSAIPDNLWLICSQGDKETTGLLPHCALGWCKNVYGMYGNATSQASTEAAALEKLFFEAGIISVRFPTDRSGWNIADVNNGTHPLFQQPTPKERILTALEHVKKVQGQKPEHKVRIEYVAVPDELRKLAREVSSN